MRKASLFLLAIALIRLPVFAQTTDFSGEWSNRNHEDATDRIGAPPIGDYLGFALNDAGRLRAQSWDGGEWSLPEFQCRPHLAPYDWRAAGDLQIMKESDPVSRGLTAYHIRRIRTMDRTIYVDGRPHPPEYAAHTWEGFSTGKWDGDILTVTTTHLKIGWIRRNGIPRSDRATLVEHWIRHGAYLTMVSIVNDPVYLPEPFIRSTDFELDPHQQ